MKSILHFGVLNTLPMTDMKALLAVFGQNALEGVKGWVPTTLPRISLILVTVVLPINQIWELEYSG